MLSESMINKLRFLWLILMICVVSMNLIYLGLDISIKGGAVIFLLTGLTMFLGWYLIVNFIFTKIAPSLYKPLLLKNPKFKLDVIMLRVILSKEAYESILNVLSVDVERNES